MPTNLAVAAVLDRLGLEDRSQQLGEAPAANPEAEAEIFSTEEATDYAALLSKLPRQLVCPTICYSCTVGTKALVGGVCHDRCAYTCAKDGSKCKTGTKHPPR